MRVLLILVCLSILPTASAAGHLVNIGVGSNSLTLGANVFGGSGDTLDVGVANAQCSDEADVVDVGVANTEGGFACQPGEECRHSEGVDPLTRILATPVGTGGEPTEASCTDDSDAVDISVLSTEGTSNYTCGEQECWESFEGDANDATDVTIGGVEYGDTDDGNDVGVLNCEYFDWSDSTDVGVLNREWYDMGDAFDLSILGLETPEGGDANGLDVGGGFGIALDCQIVRIDLPVGPGGGIWTILP